VARFRLDGKVALVTGGGRGIGAAISRACVEQGARVVVAEIDVANGERVAAELGEAAVFAPTDVAELASVEAAVAAGVARWGRLDVAVNCAGIVAAGSVLDTDPAEWDRLFAVNAKGVFHGCRAGVGQMLRQTPRGGVVINIASTAALIGLARRVAYSASKGAVLAMTRAIAVDHVRDGIRCNAICPGLVYTPLIDSVMDRYHAHEREAAMARLLARQPIGRAGTPDDIANLVVYLAADAASYITGAVLTIDGGLTMQ